MEAKFPRFSSALARQKNKIKNSEPKEMQEVREEKSTTGKLTMSFSRSCAFFRAACVAAAAAAAALAAAASAAAVSSASWWYGSTSTRLISLRSTTMKRLPRTALGDWAGQGRAGQGRVGKGWGKRKASKNGRRSE